MSSTNESRLGSYRAPETVKLGGGGKKEGGVASFDIESAAAGAGAASSSDAATNRKTLGAIIVTLFCLLIIALVNTTTTTAKLKELLARVAPVDHPYHPLEASLPGFAPGLERPHLVLAQDIDYPPYAYLGKVTENHGLAGFGHDIALGLKEVCDIDITVVETRWNNCWGAGEIGQGLMNGWFHGCMTYTHTAGQRNRFVEFSEPIMKMNKPAGLIVRLGADGEPLINGTSLLDGVKVVDVVGWAPTADGLSFVKNTCNGDKPFAGFDMVPSTHDTGNTNDDALMTVLGGDADAMWVYADQAANYQCNPEVDSKEWNCTMWTEGFGTDFAYIQTGMLGYAFGGTTLSLSRKGSGIKAILDPCIEKFKKTKSYYDVCSSKADGRKSQVDSCFPNEFFPAPGADHHVAPYKTKTSALTSNCTSGYCACPK